MAGARFRVGLSRDLLDRDGHITFDAAALAVLDDDPRIVRQWFPEQPVNVTADHLATYDAICLGAPGVPATALGRADQRTRIVARFGVGYDNCDVAAMTVAGVLLTINPDSVRRPVASSILAFILALAHRIPVMDRITRSGRWHEKMQHTGTGLNGRTLGSIGVGNIGRELFGLARPLEMQHIAYDPHVCAREAAVDRRLRRFNGDNSQLSAAAAGCHLVRRFVSQHDSYCSPLVSPDENLV